MKKKKTFVRSLVSILTLCASILIASPTMAKDDVINLKVANYLSPQSANSLIMEEFITDLEKRSHGRIKVQYLKGGSLLNGSTCGHAFEDKQLKLFES